MKNFLFLLLCAFPLVSVSGTEQLKPGSIVYSTVSVLRIRATPDLKSKQIGKLEKGDSLRILQIVGDEITVDKKKARWVEFEFNGQKGYAFAGFLSTEWPLLVHSAKEWAQIQKKNNADMARRQKAAESSSADQPGYFTECLYVSGYGYPAEYEAGCTARKLEEIRKLREARGLSRIDAVNEYGDAYCRGWLELELARINCSIDGDSLEPFPIPH